MAVGLQCFKMRSQLAAGGVRAEGRCWPLILPDHVLAGSCEVRNIFPHFHEPQLNQLRQMLPVEKPTSFRGNVHQRPTKVDGIQAKLGEWIGLVFHLLIMLHRLPAHNTL